MTIKSYLPSILAAILFVINNADAAPRGRGVMLSTDVTTADIADLAPWNVNVVRYPLTWLGPVDTANEAAFFEWLDTALVKLDTVLAACEQHKIKVLIELHTPPGGYVTRTSPAQYRIFSEKWAQNAFVKTWQMIAARYKDNTTVYGYEIVNEPALRKLAKGLLNWNNLAALTAKSIRAIDKRRLIVVNPIFGDTPRINSLRPLKLKNIAYSVHMYYPRSFTSQGLDFPLGVKYPTKKFNKAGLVDHLKKLVRFQRKNKAQIMIHEFSVARWAPGNSAAKYLKDAISIFEANKWTWFYHAYREANVWSVEHTNDINSDELSPTTTDRAAVLLSFFKRNKK